ncbi:glycogen debranching protein GlgX [Rhodopirellula sp. MGV]|uniref:glycogen debranching protein GlgX n=1 Tax=Rhodopirellula sp. MGV TaxID=2023130 RepID=UPI000B97BEE1|nr:glycogen debranching protein GlgX [Rhodopirellula sp. MGV]OYP34008.1 glycogen debranching enzyme GlgX [Rhodopirellula sp. MGV]PNY38365.1 glycogen debranching enzyme GlgX [Rhodopirellula baltica]
MLMRQPTGNLQFTYQPPFGATVQDGGVQFSVFSRSATAMRLLLYNKVTDPEPADVIEFDRDTDRWGDVWSLSVNGLEPGQLYHFQASGPWDPEKGQRFDSAARLIDPYAQALAGTFQRGDDGVVRPPKCVVVKDDFDWEDDRHVRRDLSESIIYEMHVRGFTRSRTAKIKHPGTYLGVIEKIPYLKELGVTAVELMPVNEFPILDIWGNTPERPNYWGYDPMAFFSPHRGYAHDKRPGAQVNEFKTMVKALHAAGIEVILDVVFNHTCEGNENGPTLSFKGLENQVYYILSEGKHFSNYSGCGNTINGNHPVVREMIFHCLRHWVHNYHIDGFRFDLASILSRDRSGNLIPNPPMVELIAEDPLLADTKIIAEAWDAAGAYQVGSFGNHRWAEWNGRYRDDVRGFWRGDGGTLGALATRLAGSSDLYEHAGRPPFCSINFITSHDGFTLSDLVSYKDKHNLANGEDNRDGDNHNISDNYGVEGPTRRKGVNTIRARQVRNMLATLLLSQGVPMLVSGDEVRRTQRGNNNAYCQDNDISWFDWRMVEKNADVLRFVQGLTKFRKAQPTVRRTNFLTGQPVDGRLINDVAWYSDEGHPLDWGQHHLSMVAYIAAPSRVEDPTGQGRDILMMFNSTGQDRIQQLPEVGRGMKWNLFVDTAAESPKDIFPDLDGPMPPSNRQISVPCHSLKVFVSGRISNKRRK